MTSPPKEARMADEKRIVRDIKKQYGAVIDLDRSPLVIIEIIRRFAFEVASGLDGGATRWSAAWTSARP